MFGALRNILFGSENSKLLAKSRLHFVLVQDRTGLSNDEMLTFKKDMVGVIERYFVIDEEGFDITYKREGDSTTLLINSPVLVRRAGAAQGNKAAQPQSAKDNKKRSKDGKDQEGEAHAG